MSKLQNADKRSEQLRAEQLAREAIALATEHEGEFTFEQLMNASKTERFVNRISLSASISYSQGGITHELAIQNALIIDNLIHNHIQNAEKHADKEE